MLDAKTSIAPPRPSIKAKPVVQPVVQPPSSPRHRILESEILSLNLTKQVAEPVPSVAKSQPELSETLTTKAGKEKESKLLSEEDSDDDESGGEVGEEEGADADAEEDSEDEIEQEDDEAIGGDLQLASEHETENMDIDGPENTSASLPLLAVSKPSEDEGMFYSYLAYTFSYFNF